jgi:hypothetical protein
MTKTLVERLREMAAMSKTQRPVKHTAGEWRLDPRSPGDVETPAGVQIAFGLAASQVGEEWHIKGPCPPDDEAAANARLIAAAPDLLEAARKADAVLRTMYPTVASDRDAAKVREAFDAMSAAIIKATETDQ